MTDAGQSIVSTAASAQAAGARWPVIMAVDMLRPAGGRFAALISTVAVSFMIFGLHALQGILLARILGPAARGEYATAVFYSQSLIYIGLVGTVYSVARRAAAAPVRARQLGRSVMGMSLWTGAGTMAVVTLLSLSILPNEKSHLALLCIICSCMLPWEHMRLGLLAVDHGSAQFKRYNANRIVHAAAFPAMLLVLGATGGGSLHAVAALGIAVPIPALLFRFLTAQPRSSSHESVPPPRELVREGLPYVLPDLSSNLFNRMDTFLILWLASFTVQGYYAAAVSAANLLIVAPNALALFAFNRGVRHHRPLTWRSLGGACLAIGVMQGITALALAGALSPLMVLVFGDRFRGAIPFAFALLPVYAISGGAAVVEGYLRGRNRARAEIWARLLGAAVLVLVVWLTYGRWSEMSIPVAALAGHAVVLACLLAVVARDVKPRGTDSIGGEAGRDTRGAVRTHPTAFANR